MTHIKSLFGVPAASTAGGFIYVIEFSNGVVKVGSTKNPAQRLTSHQSIASVFGVRVSSAWFSSAHENYLVSEDCLIAYASTRAGRQMRKEYFEFVSVLDLRRAARVIAESNGSAAVTIPRRVDQVMPIRQVRAMYPSLDIRAVHRGCIYGEIPAVVESREFHLSRATIDSLLRRRDLTGPSRSVRRRMERRAA